LYPNGEGKKILIWTIICNQHVKRLVGELLGILFKAATVEKGLGGANPDHCTYAAWKFIF